MNVPLIIFGILYFLNTLFRFSHAWDNDELEVFDVVEEVNQNFYDVLGVTQVIFLQIYLNVTRLNVTFSIYLKIYNDEFY